MSVRRFAPTTATSAAVVGIAVLTMAGCGVSAPDRPVAASPADSVPAAAVDAARVPAPAPSGVVVTIGDSIMAGLGLDPDQAWPSLVAADTGADIVNLGCSGAGFTITGDCGDDYAGLVQQAITLRPAIVIIQSSDNDSGASQDEIDASTRAAVDQLRAALPDVQLIGIATLWHLDWDEPDAIGWSSEALQRAVSDDDGVFVSLGQPLRGRPELLQWDGEHPNSDGQIVLSDAVEAALDDAGVVL
ncbi:SGNH/GDSL hydrolase family protein [Microbacterium sp.]|uniref:SGNH/GDSL hydrolase family protein n=1 Tax=Microbacterium sp. TaxID=51671 RepID=UPI0032429FDD